MRCAYLLLASLGLVGCGGDGDEIDLAQGCDITRAACQRAVFDATVATRGIDAPMPPVRTISLREFEDALRAQAGSETGEADVWSRTLPLLRLLPEGSTIGGESVAASVSGVAAYYHLGTKQVTVIDRGTADPLDGFMVLAHEFVHALQDASLDLRRFTDEWESSLDSSVALKSLIEGEAMVLALGVLAEARGLAPSSLNWAALNTSMRESIFDDIQAAPAPLFTAMQSLPYPLGTSQLSSLWLRDGQPAIDALYSAPQLSVLDWSERSDVTEPTRVERLDCLPTAGPSGFVAHEHEAFGPTGLLAVGVERGDAVDTAWAKALEYRGDRVIVFTDPDDPVSLAIAWRIRFDGPRAAEAFGAAVSGRLAEGAAVLVQDREVVYYGTSKPEKLAGWAEITHCGAEEELPKPAADEGEESTSARERAGVLGALPRLTGVRVKVSAGGVARAR